MSRGSDSLSAVVRDGAGGTGGVEIVLFGVRVSVDPMRKSVSMNNLSEYEPVGGGKSGGNIDNQRSERPRKAVKEENGARDGCASADESAPHRVVGNRERKRGVPWTEDEHKLFLLGLQKIGKGDWRGISRNYVKTRTPTQVASHAQKYFLRRSNLNRRRRRTSLFDITTDSVTAMPMEEVRNNHQSPAQPVPPLITPPPPFPVAVCPVLFSVQNGNPVETSNLGHSNQVNNSPAMLVHPVPIPSSSTTIDLNLNDQVPVEPFPFSLSLSLSPEQDQSLTRDGLTFKVIPGFKIGDSLVSVS